MKWKELEVDGIKPKQRHGHRAVTNGELIYYFGGGFRKICTELHVYNIKENFNFSPKTCGKVSPAANFGMILYKNTVITFGGMIEYGYYSNEIHMLHLPNYQWKRHPYHGKDCPEPRMGHSFTLADDNRVIVFGGVINEHPEPKKGIVPRYMNDLYILYILENEKFKWLKLPSHINGPSNRESHSAIYYCDKIEIRKFLIIFGGMNGERLGDLWFLDLDQLIWVQYEVVGLPATPRSIHTAALIDSKMYIFGGWVDKQPRKPVCSSPIEKYETTNLLSYVDLEKMEWFHFNGYDESVPCPRAGHSMVATRDRLYLWSGRKNYGQSLEENICINDFWYLETALPRKITEIKLIRSTQSILEIKWDDVPNADFYLVEIHKVRADIDISKLRIKGPRDDKGTVIFIQSKHNPSENSSQLSEKKIAIEVKAEPIIKDIKTEFKDDFEKMINPIKIVKTEDKTWLTVGIYKQNQCTIDGYFTFEINKTGLNSNNRPQPESFVSSLKVPLTIGTMFAFRVTGINILGIGEWSKIFSFKTCETGPATTPHNCKFMPTLQGLRLAWTPNPSSERVTCYNVYIASCNVKQLTFLQVYEGSQPTCHITRTVLDSAYHQIINNQKNVIFRISATNDLGSSCPLMVNYPIFL